MNLEEAMQGHMMDAQIDADVSPRYFELKEQRLGYFVRWCAMQGVTTPRGRNAECAARLHRPFAGSESI